MTAPPNPPSPSSNLSNLSILPKILARSTTLELHDKYKRNDRYIRYGLKDYWIKNYFLTLYIALAGIAPGRQVIVVTVNDNDYDDYNSSDDGFELSSSYDRTRNELEAEVDKMVADRPEID